MPIATAIASAAKPDPELAADVVREALARCGTDIAQSVLLFLSDDFARHAQPAVHAASRAANCLQVAGCTAPGVFTEDDWILDRPAACAMVFGAGVALGMGSEAHAEPLLTLSVPPAATSGWIESSRERFGMISTDGSAQNPGRVWGHGKVSPEGRFEAILAGAHAAIGTSQGLRILTPPLAVEQVSGYDMIRLGGQPALNTLLRELPLEVREEKHLPLHLLFAAVVSGEPGNAVEDGRYTLVPLITVSHDERAVTLATRLKPGTHLFWGMRSALAAERDMRALVDTLAARLDGRPDFALMFSCMGRGPYFFGGDERDLALVKERFPGLPLAGAYGSGEIGRFCGGNRIMHNTAVLGLFRADV